MNAAFDFQMQKSTTFQNTLQPCCVYLSLLITMAAWLWQQLANM